MPRLPRADLSRFKFADIAEDSDGNAYLEDREPITYIDRPDNVLHIVNEGDTLDSLAQRYYWYIDDDAAQFWWAIAEYQPDPIINPFVPLKPGRLIVLPSPQHLSSEILASAVEPLQ